LRSVVVVAAAAVLLGPLRRLGAVAAVQAGVKAQGGFPQSRYPMLLLRPLLTVVLGATPVVMASRLTTRLYTHLALYRAVCQSMTLFLSHLAAGRVLRVQRRGLSLVAELVG
jgi:hypothetical protein